MERDMNRKGSNIPSGVVVVHYGDIRFTLKCLKRLKESTVPLQIVLVNNDPLQEGFSSSLPEMEDVKIIRSHNVGFAGGNNLGIRWLLEETRCPYIFLLNNDAYIANDTVEIMQKTMEKEASAGLVTPRIVMENEPHILWYGGGEMNWWRGAPVIPGYLESARSPIALRPRTVTFASGCAMMIRREALENIGLLDERYFMYVEDVEFSRRVISAGWKIYYSPGAVVYHVGQGSGKAEGDEVFFPLLHPENANLPFHTFYLIRNRLLLIHDHGSLLRKLQFGLVFPVFVMKLIISFLINRRFDALSQIFKGYTDYRKIRKTSPEYHVKERNL